MSIMIEEMTNWKQTSKVQDFLNNETPDSRRIYKCILLPRCQWF